MELTVMIIATNVLLYERRPIHLLREDGQHWSGEGRKWSEVGRMAGWRSVRTNYSAKKMPNGEPLGIKFWWRRGELNPRPQVLRHKVYMLISLFNLANDYPSSQENHQRFRKVLAHPHRTDFSAILCR